MGGSDGLSLNVLIAEDSEDDALLLLRELQRGGYAVQMQQVDSSADMQSALELQAWDLILADHNMPNFNSTEALELARQHDPNTPFILVSGSIGEEIAVDAMKSGAHDYVMKNNLTRLLPAIERELRESENRRAHQAAEAKIRHMAFHDNLTGLINRVEFERHLNAVVDSSQQENESHALLYIDLDQFKLVNDSCGHLAGDSLLRSLSQHLQKNIRDSDILARLGGDEFGVLLRYCPLERAETIARELLNTIRHFHFVWDNRTFRVGASIGLVIVNGEQTTDALLSMADMACYAAKDRGRNRIHSYTEDDTQLTLRRGEMQWIHRLQDALGNSGLVLYQQRIQGLQGETTHCELLLRMRGIRGDIITPDKFIPAAERYNLMPEVDQWVIENTCKILEKLQALQQYTKAQDTFFINLSGNSLSDDNLAAYIHEQLQHYNISPERIGFEITETAAIADIDCAIKLIKALRGYGCKVSLDDFGTGMSSFSYLKQLEVDFIKIDGSFVRSMLEEPMDNAIVEAINTIGHVAGIQTIAEFVESDAVLQQLAAIGVDFAQGWAVEHPQPFVDL